MRITLFIFFIIGALPALYSQERIKSAAETSGDRERQGPAANKTYSILDQLESDYDFKDFFDEYKVIRL